MKKLSFFIIVIFFSLASVVHAQNATSSALTKTQINDLKDRLATKAAELRKLQKKAIYGMVKDISVSTFTVETALKDIKLDRIDELAVVQMIKSVRTKLTAEDIDKNDLVTVFGSYDSSLEVLTPSLVFIQSVSPVHFSGVVKSIDKDKGNVTVELSDGKTAQVEFEKTTKTMQWTHSSGMVKSGFSKIAVLDQLSISAFAVAKKADVYSAVRVVDLGNLDMQKEPTNVLPSPQIASPSATIGVPTVTVTSKVKPTPTGL